MNKCITLQQFQIDWARDEIFKELRHLKKCVSPKEKLKSAALVEGLAEMACICKIITVPTFWRINHLVHVYETVLVI